MDRNDENLLTRSLVTEGEEPSSVSEPPPVEDWERYRLVGFLGDGGMGRVYKAFDPKLRRFAALKFIRGDSPRLVRRFEQEARAQAQVDHENVCKVYEVGEVEGRPYIAMQFIEGEPLNRAAREMTLEQKLLAMRDVARGLHAAHRNGLIHRDVKPGNILVEKSHTGRWKPFVVDFGLAREPGSSGMTIVGSVIGTPHYMSPEQAAGRIEQLDRRSDVYGLGATLYEMLVGCPPFRGDSPTRVLMRVMEDAPDPIRRRGLAIPADVEAIVMKCLRKSPGERYDSARALAEDLQRYLDGEPVHARRTGLLYRLRIKAARHKTAVAVGAVASALLAVSLAWGGYQSWTSARRTRLAQSFGRQVEKIEALARYSHTVPLHDVRQDRTLIRGWMDEIESRMRESGGLAEGPGQYALGRGFLALGDHESAHDRLAGAWEAGYREPELANALGRVLGRIYMEELREADQIRDPEARDLVRRRIESEYREPALEFLRLGKGVETESVEYGEALIAYYEGRYDQALEMTRRAYEGRTWFYEAMQLEGDIHASRGSEAALHGDYEIATEAFRLAEESYLAAAAVGESDPSVHASLCSLGRSRMLMQLYGRGAGSGPGFEAAEAACDQALLADPEFTDALILKAWMHNHMGNYRRHLGEDPVDDLHEAIAIANRVLSLRSDHALAHAYVGAAYNELANLAMDRGADPGEELENAIAAYRRALEIQPGDVKLLNDLGVAYKNRANHEMNGGADPRESLHLAIDAYRESITIEPEQVAANTNLGVVLFKLSGIADDPGPLLRQAIASFGKALEIHPDQMVVQYHLGRALAAEGDRIESEGGDPREMLARAAEAYRRAMEINPESAYRAHFLNGLGRTHHQSAEYEHRRGLDPGRSIEEAAEAYSLSLEANPRLVYAHDNLGALHVFQADYRLDTGRDPGDAPALAEQSCRRAIEIKPDYFFAHLDLVDALRVRARAELERGGDPEPAIEKGLAALRLGEQLNPNSSELAALGEELRRYRKVWRHRSGAIAKVSDTSSR